MPTSSTYYSLQLYNNTTDASETFLDYRTDVNGTAPGSNANIIDSALNTNAVSITALEARKNVIAVPAVFQSANYYEATVSAISTYETDMVIAIELDADSAGTVTLKINALATKSLMKVTSAGAYVNLDGADLRAAREYIFKYDGTRWVWVGATSGDQINMEGTTSDFVMINSDNELEDSAVKASDLATIALDNLAVVAVNTTLVSDTDDTDSLGTAAKAWKALLAYASRIKEKAAASADVAGWGEYWVKTATPNIPMFTNDIGYDFSLISSLRGHMLNGKLSASVATNDLTVAVKGLDGNDPSVTNPVRFIIGDTEHILTAALSVTALDATNWCNSGGSELATKAVGYFVYLGYNSSDGIVIGFSRIPYATTYADFSATSTNETFCKINDISNAVGGDEYENVGYLEAVLSAGAGYVWSAPANVISKPKTESRDLDWQPTFTAQAGTYNTVTTNIATYKVSQKKVSATIKATGTTSSTPTYLEATLPFEVLNKGAGSGFVFEGTNLSAIVQLAAGSPDTVQFSRYDFSTFSAGAIRIINGNMDYVIE